MLPGMTSLPCTPSNKTTDSKPPSNQVSLTTLGDAHLLEPCGTPPPSESRWTPVREPPLEPAPEPARSKAITFEAVRAVSCCQRWPLLLVGRCCVSWVSGMDTLGPRLLPGCTMSLLG